MRVLCIPFVSLTNVSGDSSFLGMLATMKVMKKKVPDLHVYITVPHGTRLEKQEDWIHVLGDYPFLNRQEQCLVPPGFYEKFSIGTQMLPVDLVFTSRLIAAPQIVSMVKDVRWDVGIPVVLYDLTAGGIGDAADVDTVWMEKMKAYAYTLADFVYYLTPNEREAAIELCRKYLSPSEVAGLRFFDRFGGIDAAEVEAIRDMPVERPDKRKTVLFGGRLNNTKNWREIVEVMDLAYSAGQNIRCIISTPTVEEKFMMVTGEDLRKKYGSVEWHFGVSRSEYLKLLKQADVFVYSSKTEGFPAGVAEALYMGLVGVFHRSKWQRHLLPDDYPYRYGGVKDGAAMLVWVLKNLESEEVLGTVEATRAKLKAEWADEWSWMRDMITLERDSTERAQGMLSSDYVVMLEETLKSMPDEFLMDMFWDEASKKSRKGSKARDSGMERGWMPKWYAWKWLQGKARDMGGLKPLMRKLP